MASAERISPGRRAGTAVAAVAMLVLAWGGLGTPAGAQAGGATPASGSVGPGAPDSSSWSFDPIVGAGVGGTPIEAVCPPGECSKYTLTVKLPEPDAVFYTHYRAVLTYRCSWADTAPSDVDCFAFDPAGVEAAGPGSPDNLDSTSYEEMSITNPSSGDWSLRADEAAGVSSTVIGRATLSFVPLGAALPVQTTRPGDARFTNYDFSPSYQTRDALGRPNAGEPSIGVDWNAGSPTVMYMAGNQVTRIVYDSSTPPRPTTTDVTPPISKVNEDAILFTDHDTHRTWALGLLLAGSYEAYSDNAGATWTPAVAFSAPALPDHETLGAGPYHSPAPAHSYPHAVYYCAQTIVQDAYCGRSDDGGATFSPVANPLWHGKCAGLHGHVRVGPTGTVYVPNARCTDSKLVPRSGVAVSQDNGATFTVSLIPDSSAGTSDPSVMEGPDGTVYFGYQASNGHPMMAISHDQGATWAPSIDVGQFADATTEDGMSHGVQNTEFSEVITGDAGRAAFAFLGTGTPGAYQAGRFPGTWYLFVSYTFDGGRTWRTVNATPNDPVQRGCVWNGGLVNACRNMLDFNDIGVDSQGHVYVAYTDGCTTSATYSCDTTRRIAGWNNVTSGSVTNGCQPSELSSVESTATCTFARLSAVVRQVCGRGLIAAYDPGFLEDPSCLGGNVLALTAPPTGAGALGGGTAAAVALAAGGAGLLGLVARRRRRRSC